MATIGLYAATVLIWGASWIMMTFQVGVVPVEASIAYRFAAASLFMFVWVFVRRLSCRFSAREHGFIALQGTLIFCLNYYLFYLATPHITTGLIAVVMSTASIITLLVSSALTRRMPSARVLAGVMLGVTGIAIIFWPEVAGFSFQSTASIGLIYSLGGTTSFAIGGMVAARNQESGMPVRGSTAWAMAYGAALLALLLVMRGGDFTFDPRLPYVASFVFLAVFASVIAFALYFALLARIGTERSAYVTVLFPVVALTLSTFFEGYTWTLTALTGVALTLAGNVLVLLRSEQAKR